MTGLRKKDLLILIVSLVLGGGLIIGNFFHYQSIQTKYSVTYLESPETLTIRSNDPASLSFKISNPDDMGTLRAAIQFRDIAPQTSLDISINQMEPETVSGLQSGAIHTVTIEPENVQRVNTIHISGDFGFSRRAEIGSVVVNGVTGIQRIVFLLLNILGLITAIGPILVTKYLEYSRRSKMEQEFPNFLRDVVEGIRAGMPLPQSIQNTRNNNYGALTPLVEEMAAKLEWGISFDKAVTEFGRKTHSPIVKRAVNTIVQTYQAGGDVDEVLSAVGDNLKQIRRLRQQRQSQIYGQMITGYIIYFVFLMVLVVLIRYLLPSLTFEGGIGALQSSGLSSEELITTYRSVFRYLVIVQSIFSGLVIGRLSEGELKAGAKHVGILLSIGYTVAAVFM
ncbi:MAG: type II secretion system F family protein [Candidatus Nanohaloarchaea archaeon]|nr:type II secretion system F family protein [Candidatus Nanohaloarchaea archaeon]